MKQRVVSRQPRLVRLETERQPVLGSHHQAAAGVAAAREHACHAARALRAQPNVSVEGQPHQPANEEAGG
jgi:hypothetical protein